MTEYNSKEFIASGSTAESLVSIHLYTVDVPLLIPIGIPYTAETICITAAQQCQIGPVCRHLFALQSSDGLFLSPCEQFKPAEKKKYNLKFRLRYRMKSLSRLRHVDINAFNYYFRQIRSDFLDGHIIDFLKLQDSALGLAVTDMLQTMLEKNLPIDAVQKDYRSFLPKEINRNYKFGIKKPIQKALLKAKNNSKGDATFVKEEYMQQVFELVPEYGCEKYCVVVDDYGFSERIVTVDPDNSEEPDLKISSQNDDSSYVHVCTIEELCHISMRINLSEETARFSCTVEISRRNGVPLYFNFENERKMHSFVSLLDGYYRLNSKWTFNLCKDLPTPSLMLLKALKCHGPVNLNFTSWKLREKRQNKAGTFIFRESAEVYGNYVIDVCCDSKQPPETFHIRQTKTRDYQIDGMEDVFPTVALLLNRYHKYPIKDDIVLIECLPPSEYDQTNLLLCRAIDKDYHGMKAMAGDCKCSAKCIPQSAVLCTQLSKDTFPGKSTVVRKAYIHQESGNKVEVAVKTLLTESFNRLQEFLNLANEVLFWQCESIVSTMGVVLASPVTLVMEYVCLGPLDKYLQNNKINIREVDLVESATYIAKALWYLEECGHFHGKIRCSNILVHVHEENSFKVKLGHPGLSKYTQKDIHWIPREFHDDFNRAKNSHKSDVWAFGTTLWEIFSYGKLPSIGTEDIDQIKAMYRQGVTLSKPENCHENIDKLMRECWVKDADERKQPQAIMRDINQTLYEVYNSRRSHSYTAINPSSSASIVSNRRIDDKITQVVAPALPPKPPNSQLPKSNRQTIFKSALDKLSFKDSSVPYDTFSSNSGTTVMSIDSSQTESCSHSTATTTSFIDNSEYSNGVPIGSLISIADGPTDTSQNVDRSLHCVPSATSLMNMDQSIWLIESHQLDLGPRLGQGFYGEVCKATLTQWSGLGKETVAVKRLKKSNFSISGFLDLQREITIMKSLQHKNIAEIKGVVEEPELLLVMEYLPLGSMLVYIKTYKEKLNRHHLLKFATDVAEGMEYLGNKNIVHRDLAARNILVAPNEQVKISDFGLAQVTGNPVDNPYYWLKTNRDLPIRWYALESIKYGKFSTKSDAWSFGITLWEMFSYGEEPIIPGVTDDDLLANLERGVRLGAPGDCPNDVYQLMLLCWQADSHERLTFTEIRERIDELKNSD